MRQAAYNAINPNLLAKIELIQLLEQDSKRRSDYFHLNEIIELLKELFKSRDLELHNFAESKIKLYTELLGNVWNDSRNALQRIHKKCDAGRICGPLLTIEI